MTAPAGIVFGGSHGIGAATALALAEHGASVVVAARSASSCHVVVDKIMARGGKAMAMSCDVSHSDQVAAVIALALQRFGRLDYIINSAGVMDPLAPIEESPPDAWARCIEINLNGSFYACHAALPIFRAQNSGVIVNLSSGAAFHALEGWSAYCAAKAGLAMLTRVLTAETAGSDIRIYGFQPGMINTELTRSALRHKVNRIADLDPATFDSPEAPAAAIAWLCRHRPRDLCGGEVVFADPAFKARIRHDSQIFSSESIN